MRSLYWRIFLSFGVTMALVVSVSVLISFRAASHFAEAMEDARPHELISEASRVLAEGGEQELREWLQRKDREQTPAIPLVVTQDGKELLDRQLPARFVDRLRRAVEWRRPGAPANLRPPLPLPRIVSAEGIEYLVVLVPRRPGPFGILGLPGARSAIVAVALLITAIASFVLARGITAPIHELEQASRRLASGVLSTRVGSRVARRQDELGLLAREFDAMAARLAELIGSQQDLLRNVSHELRTPLTRIQMAVELVRRNANGEDAELDRIVAECGRLDHLIGQVLALARLDRSVIELRREPVRLDLLLDELAKQAELEAAPRNIQIRVAAPADMDTWVDLDLITSALENILRNALRFSPAQGRVDLTATRDNLDPSWVSVRVSDRGPGVPEDDLGHIFSAFHKVDRSRGPDSGEGVGLAIAERAVRLHAGTVSASNRSGGGLEVEIRLPTGADSA